MANTTYSIQVPATPTSAITGTSVGAARKEHRTFTLAGPSPGDEVTILGSQDNTNYQVVTDGNGQPLILTYGTPTRTITDNSLYYRTLRQGFGAGSTLAAVQMCGEDLTSSSSVNSTPVTSGSYTVGANDSSIDVNFAGPVAITLPTPTAGRLLRIHDVGGVASALQAITATAAGGSTIDNQATVYVMAAFGYVDLYGVSSTQWQVVNRSPTNVLAPQTGPYTVTPWDDIIPVDTTGGAVTITLPAAPLIGEQHLIVDTTGQASVTPITVARNGKLINSASVNVSIASARGHCLLKYAVAGSGSGWIQADMPTGIFFLGVAQVANAAGGGTVGSAANTVDIASVLEVNQTTTAQVRSLPAPTVTLHERQLLVVNVGTALFGIGDATLAQNIGVFPGQSVLFTWNGSAWVPSSGYQPQPVPGGNQNSTGNVNRAGQFTLCKITSLGGAITLTVTTTGANAGDVMEFSRTDTSANTVALVNGGGGGGTLTTMPVSKAGVARIIFDGTNWSLEFAASQ